MKIGYCILFILTVAWVCILYTVPTPEEYKAAQDVKYKNGAIVIERNKAGCTKYEYYDSKFWKCTDTSIDYVEERVCSYSITTKTDQCRFEQVMVTR